jgi:hypothetical protein
LDILRLLNTLVNQKGWKGMKVSKSDTLAGFPLIKIRDLLRPYREGAITGEDVHLDY